MSNDTNLSSHQSASPPYTNVPAQAQNVPKHSNPETATINSANNVLVRTVKAPTTETLMNFDTSPVSLARTNELVRLGTTVPHKNLQNEAELVTLKWPAYRFLSPRVLNAKFCEAYNNECKRRRPRNLLGPRANLGGISSKLNLWIRNAQLTQIHKARQHADRTGMPYDEYIRFSFVFADGRKRGFLSRPNQLKPTKKAEAAWTSLLVDYWTPERFWLQLGKEPAMPQYSLEFYTGLPAQLAFRKNLMWLAESRATNAATFYGKTVLANQWLEAEELIATNSNIWMRAKESAEDDQARGEFQPVTPVTLTKEDQLQGCYGVPGIDTATTETCMFCSARLGCSQFRSQMLENLRDRYGSVDPIREEELRKNRERVAKYRAKMRAGASSRSSEEH